MLKHEQPETVSCLLSDADRKFTDGEVLKASELMWKATRQAVAAVAARRDWPCNSDEDISHVIRRLDEERGTERTLLGKFGIAETFPYNATQDIPEDCEINAARGVVVDLINHLLSHLQDPAKDDCRGTLGGCPAALSPLPITDTCPFPTPKTTPYHSNCAA